MNKKSTRVLLIFAAFALFIVPVVALAAAGFDDVDDDNVFVADIQWMKDNGITKGCNPPTNTNFCPDKAVTRQQMAAFMHRLAVNKVVDAATAVDADMLDGKDSTEYLTKAVYDTNDDAVVDSAQVKIRYSTAEFTVDMEVSVADRVQCVTDPVTFDGVTTVVASGGLSLEPIGTSTDTIHGHVRYSRDGGTTWIKLNGVGIEEDPEDGAGEAGVPLDAVKTLAAGTYDFSIDPRGSDYQVGDDYNGWCELTVTAYTGLGASIDVAVNSTVLTVDETDR